MYKSREVLTSRNSKSTIRSVKLDNFKKPSISISPLNYSPEPGFINCQNKLHDEVDKLAQKIRQNRRKLLKRDLSSHKGRAKQDFLTFEDQNMPYQLAMMNHYRREIVNELIHFKHRDLTPEKLEELRESLTPTIVHQMNEEKRLHQGERFRQEILSRSPHSNAIYSLAALPKLSKHKVIKSLERIIPDSSRFKIE
ncbi:unnamed protein product [Blepharisma stoltei]|uniref:Uncharacterized protein n=1 Tax=Blepharisma stoltei TaxID=1481888 RepID=A0AAU9J9I3_9CILI|nr:unnamed protein product [Blepharisma stoltei]